jgi:hypothetical protein
MTLLWSSMAVSKIRGSKVLAQPPSQRGTKAIDGA